jgi:hypothetical protein
MRRLSSGITVLLLSATSLFAAKLPNVDAFGQSRGKGVPNSAVAERARNLVKPGSRIQVEPRLGVPTVLWAGTATPAELVAGSTVVSPNDRAEVAAARGQMQRFANVYGLRNDDVASAVVADVHNTGRGPIIVKFRQEVDGVEIFREEMNVLMNRQYELVALGGYITSVDTPPARNGQLGFTLDERNAAVNAVQDLTLAGLTSSQLVQTGSKDGYDYYTTATTPDLQLEEPIRTKKVYFHLAEGLEPAYYVEVAVRQGAREYELSTNDGEQIGRAYYSYVISAIDGRVLFRNNLTADSQAPGANVGTSPNTYSFRVWADPATGMPLDGPFGNSVHPKVVATPDGLQPPYIAPSDLTVTNYPFSMNDPWLPASSVETVGNNADAYVDVASPDGYGPVGAPSSASTADFRAQATGTNEFLHTFDPTLPLTSAEQRQGAIQQLFYNVNFLHDWFYDSGFTETGRNAQASNFGRGGVEGDSMRAEAQDSSGTNNANMSTPADGGRPRMQMYVFTSNGQKYLDVVSPANIAGKRTIGTAAFGPQSFDLTNEIIQAQMGAAPSCTFANAAAITGKFVMVDYGTGSCFSASMNNAIAAGAAGYILVFGSAGNPNQVANVGGTNAAFTFPWTCISWNGGAGIKTEIAAAHTVMAHIYRESPVARDGSIDNAVVFHEWGHYLSNRQIGNANGLINNQARSMGEGWSDFVSMLLLVRAEDASVASNPNFSGVYPSGTYVTGGTGDTWAPNGNGAYFGIRRYPYSTDMTKNPLTFKHITNGIALPAGPPVSFGAAGTSNSEVHSAGEVWAETLWECYAALLRDTQGTSPRFTFDEAQSRMKMYLVASLKLTPVEPTYTEARDAVLAAAFANDYVDYTEFLQAFAKRGMGVDAVSPDRWSTTHAGTVESFDATPELLLVSSSVDDSVASCDHDGILDASDVGHLNVTLRNVGTSTLTGTTGTVTSTTAGVSFPNGNTIVFPTSTPRGTTTGSIVVALDPSVTGVQQLDFHVTYTDPQFSAPRSIDVSHHGNSTVTASYTRTDDVEAPSAWIVSSNPALGAVDQWYRYEVSTMAHQWQILDPNLAADEYLTSPVMTVDGSGSVNLQFDHSFSFEFDVNGNYDGGVVEMSVNGGAWTNISTAPYNGTITNYTGNLNPLGGRAAFVKTGSGHVSLTAAVAPGSTVRFRFRFGADSAGGARGWIVDNMAVSGVVETPFAGYVADVACQLASATSLTSSANPAPAGTSVTLTATVSGGGVPTGTVTFFDGTTSLGSSSLSSGVATYSTSGFSIGSHTLTAQYSGDTRLAGSASSNLYQTISAATTTTSLTMTGTTTFGRPQTFVATVVATSGSASGSVVFKDNGSTIATVALSSGTASLTTTSLAVGPHSIVAMYGGNASYGGSTSTAVTFAINTAKTDLTGEGRSDIVLQNSSTSAVAAWNMNGSTITAGSNIATPTSDWKVVATGDLEGDGHADIILQNSSTGAIAEWRMNGLSMISGANVTIPVAMQRVVGTYDFNHDGKADIIVQNVTTGSVAEWQMNGATIAAAQVIATPNMAQRAIATGNIGGDAIVFQNTNTGDVSRWLIDGFTLTAGKVIGTAAAARLIATGDFNVDGVDDLLFQADTNTNAVSVWRLNAAGDITSAIAFATPISTQKVLGTGDYDGDGRAEVLLQNSSNNTVSMWQTDGTTLLSGVIVSTPAAGWKPIVN